MADAFGPRPGVSVARFRRSGGVLLATPLTPYRLVPLTLRLSTAPSATRIALASRPCLLMNVAEMEVKTLAQFAHPMKTTNTAIVSLIPCVKIEAHRFLSARR